MKRRFQIAILLSIFMHVSLTVFLLSLDKKVPSLDSRPIEMTFVDPEQMKLSDVKQMQIVDQSEKSVNDETPEDAKFLSRNNQKVAEETRAAMHGRFNNEAGQGLAPQGPQKEQKVGQPSKQQKLAQNKDQAKTKSEPVAPWEVAHQKTNTGLPTLEALKPKFDWNKMAGSAGAVENPRNPSASDDYLKDVKTGAQTMLNTREFVYFSYYNRIKNQLQQYWEPKIKDKVTKLFRQGRQIASEQDRVTRVRITLDSKGVLIGVAVLGNSGIQELDEAAVEAFRAAAPFPNPPKGIVDTDGTIKIDWSFILEA